jgi:ketosteroid isomerase-like protein
MSPSTVSAALDDAKQLKALSQAYSDASAANDVPLLRKLLDDRVTFINENGEIATKADLTSGPPTPNTPGQTRTLTQRNFKVQLFGDTAVTSFTDHLALHAYGQLLTEDFLSTEVWRRETGGWKMISSQTIALPVDPPAVTLPADSVEQYVGKYVAGPGLTISIVRSGVGLAASTNGGPSVKMEAEVRDVFFTPGRPRIRRIFERKADGAITGFVSRHEGHDTRFRRA